MPMIEKSSASSFRIRAGIRSDFQPHDIVVHVESACDFENAFAQFAHTHPFVEFYGFVMAIYVELHPAGSRVELFDVFDSLAEEEAPRVHTLESGQDVDFFAGCRGRLLRAGQRDSRRECRPCRRCNIRALRPSAAGGFRGSTSTPSCSPTVRAKGWFYRCREMRRRPFRVSVHNLRRRLFWQ